MGHKIKSRLKKDGIYINNFVRNYFAAWTANLGVVPLFLLAAFLLAPAFFFFLNLLFVVTHVLETIRKLLSRNRYNGSLYNNFKPYFLPIKSPCVKGIVAIPCTCLFLFLPMAINAETIHKDIILARGQSTELSLSGMEKFNIGNRQVITYRLNEKSKKLLVRGVSLGHSEILVWNRDKSTETYQIFVISKIQEAKFLHLAEITSNLGLNTQILIPHIRVSGLLKKYSQYLDYKKILEQNKEAILDEVQLSVELKNKIFASVYSAFFEDYKESIRCSLDFSEISCFYPENEAPGEFLKKYLIEKYKINLVQQNNQQFKKNYSLKIKLIQLEQLDGEDLRLGLEQVSGSLGDFFKIPLDSIVQKNQVLLAQKKVRMSTLAEPQSLIRPLTPAEMQIGADIPFKNINTNNVQSTDWKFAGLKIKILLENYGENIKINYETELTQPSNDANGVTSIGGNKEKSSVIIPLKTAVKIFQLSLKTEGKSTDQMPFLNAIPLLGELFKSKSNQSNYKTITGIIEVCENDE
ncbi:MAG: pilus assembly protein N-terminal domain-containing protein [Bacteriovorax sp.]|nr:pilus assembly protein N-terminal domain-containing protein [Bacteriovorax sp.]